MFTQRKYIFFFLFFLSVQVTAFTYSLVIDLGKPEDYSKKSNFLLPNLRAWLKGGVDGERRFRYLKRHTSADIFFFADQIDSKGLPEKDMVLEIWYRDDWAEKQINNSTVSGRPVIKVRLDYTKQEEYFEVGSLIMKGQKRWRKQRVFIEKTPWQMLRSINGSFQFKIEMPDSENVDLPVDRLTLRSMDHDEFVKLRELDRKNRGGIREELEFISGGVPAKEEMNQGLIVFSANYLELIPQMGLPEEYKCSEVKAFEIPGHKEPIVLVVHAFKDMDAIHLEVSPLSKEQYSISSDNIEIRRVVYNDQRWGWEKDNVYGASPDYLLPLAETFAIRAGYNQPIWLNVNVPDQTPAGIYNGIVSVSAKGNTIQEISVQFEVLPVRLMKSKISHLIYHSPYFKNYHTNPRIIFADMKEHGVVPILYPKTEIKMTRTGTLSYDLSAFDSQMLSFVRVFPETKNVFIGLSDYTRVWKLLDGPHPSFQRSFRKFDEHYGSYLKEYSKIAQKYGVEIVSSFADEPNTNPTFRRFAYLCSSIAQNNGLKTWCAYMPSADKQLKLSITEQREGVNYLRPLSEVLDFLVAGIWTVNPEIIKKYNSRNQNLSYYTTFYATSPRPVFNRFLHGLCPHVVGSDVVLSYAYRDYISNPYDDMDYRSNQKKLIGLNDFILTYPSWRDGIIPTLAYESLREGVEDAGLISTLYYWIEKGSVSGDPERRTKAKDAKQYLKKTFSKVSRRFYEDYWKPHKKNVTDPVETNLIKRLSHSGRVDYTVFDKIRYDVCKRIIELQEVE